MCDFLSVNICRDGRLVADGVHGHTELARRYIGGENGIGRQRFWEWELTPRCWSDVPYPTQPLRGDCVPDRVVGAADELVRELRTLNGISSLLPWLAVLRTGTTAFLPSVVRSIVLLGDAILKHVDGAQCVVEMHDSSQVGKMHDSSRVGEMWHSSQVGEMWRSSQVGEMCLTAIAPREPGVTT